jgi:(E)-4-hydroxy-3-methylbut-2-enyl-diphosphate synthase
MNQPEYALSRFRSLRRPTREVVIGGVGVGGKNPIRLQSMTTSDTQDVEATVRQCIALAEVGCEIIRITAPNKQAAAALGEISKKFRAAGFNQPLVADIHFLPVAAMEAVEHVEKVRVNPGNYADKKKFAEREYTDAEYDLEIERLHDAFSPLVKRAKTLGRALRIGTNHGSLSDRIMNRFGDSPEGMVQSALEFIRICESHNFHDIVLSMKSSNPKVMIESYRLAVKRMNELGMKYPLHLGVTEAGEGEDARIKSAIGIGALLQDGLGDTIRVSLTEDPWYEVPVARDLAERAHAFWRRFDGSAALPGGENDGVDAFHYNKRETVEVSLGEKCVISADNPPRVLIPAGKPLSAYKEIAKEVLESHAKQKEVRAEGVMVKLESREDLPALGSLRKVLGLAVKCFVVEPAAHIRPADLHDFTWDKENRLIVLRHFCGADSPALKDWLEFCSKHDAVLAVDANAESVKELLPILGHARQDRVFYTLARPAAGFHALGSYRDLVRVLREARIASPVWIRATADNAVDLSENSFQGRLMEASMLAGPLFCDGMGDLISVETEPSLAKGLVLGYNILQGARMRQSKTEYVACPSCGRTLFDIQSTTLKIKERTGHLKGVTIAVMGCIVNGPGEMADADFGYVGGAPGKINLYVRKNCVKFNIDQSEAVDRLVDLIKEHGKWVEADAIALEA